MSENYGLLRKRDFTSLCREFENIAGKEELREYFSIIFLSSTGISHINNIVVLNLPFLPLFWHLYSFNNHIPFNLDFQRLFSFNSLHFEIFLLILSWKLSSQPSPRAPKTVSSKVNDIFPIKIQFSCNQVHSVSQRKLNKKITKFSNKNHLAFKASKNTFLPFVPFHKKSKPFRDLISVIPKPLINDFSKKREMYGLRYHYKRQKILLIETWEIILNRIFKWTVLMLLHMNYRVRYAFLFISWNLFVLEKYRKVLRANRVQSSEKS